MKPRGKKGPSKGVPYLDAVGTEGCKVTLEESREVCAEISRRPAEELLFGGKRLVVDHKKREWRLE